MITAMAVLAACAGSNSVATTTKHAEPAASTSSTETTSAPGDDISLDPAALDDPGTHSVGIARLDLPGGIRDSSTAYVSYPALESGTDVAPDLSGAPYPVVLGTAGMGLTVGSHLASHGFVFVALSDALETEEIDGPVEFSAALDGLDTLEGSALTGMADTMRAGVMGYSGESLFALMLAGARIDPAHHAAECAQPPEAWGDVFRDLVCSEDWWATLQDRARLAGIFTEEGLWGSLGDPRILASMPMGPRGFYLTGADGLASATVPILMIVGGGDLERRMETAAILESYPEGLAQAITFEGAGHMMIFDGDVQAQIERFAVLFLGLHLQGIEEYRPLLSAEFVEQQAVALGDMLTFDGLVWGVPDT